MRASRLALAAIAAAAALSGGCVRTIEPAPAVTTPRYPDFVFPAVPASLASETLTALQQRGWQFLQSGDAGQARRAFNAALAENGRFYPADAGLAYASLADRDYADAVARFDRVLRRAEGYVPAMVGKGDALAGAGRVDEAIRVLNEALAADASLTDVRRRLDVLAFRNQQDVLRAARQDAETGRLDEAAAGYERAIAASPDSGLLYRELAAVERKAGKSDQALAHLRKAVSLDPSDARGFVQTGELLEDRGEFAGAVDAYLKAEALEPGEEARARVAAARSRADLARLPEEYPSHRGRAAGDARRPRGAHRRTAEHRAEGRGRRGRRGRDRRQRPLGSPLDHGGGARGDHGPLSEPRVRPRGRRAAPRPRAGGESRARADRRTEARAGPGVAIRAAADSRSADRAPGVSCSGDGGGGERDVARRGRLLQARAGGGRQRSHRRRDAPRGAGPMTTWTVANQLTLLRMGLIPAFVIMIVYGRPGWALATFVLAGITDGLDGLIARRAGQQTSLGAWLDPMADKLLLVTTFVVLTVPGTDLVNRFPLWLTILVITRDVVIVTTVAIVTAVMGVRTFKPSIFGKAATAVYVGTCVILMWFNFLGRTSVLVQVGIWTSLGITLLSGFHYVAHAARIINAPAGDKR